MSNSLRLVAPTRKRRSHAERRAETRAKIIHAMVESIAEVGFQRSTANEVTRRAGVTWGAVQHHFRDKEGILMAVLEESFQRFSAELLELNRNAPLPQRIQQFVAGAWTHFSGSYYRSTFEILLNHALSEKQQIEESWQTSMFRAWNQTWLQIFHDVKTPRKRQLTLQHYTISVLSGLASMKILEGKNPAQIQQELGLLQETLVRELHVD